MSIRRSLVRALVALPLACAAVLATACNGVDRTVAPTATLAAPSPAARAVAPGEVAHFYVQAFVEDWQLLMGDRVPASLSSAAHVVFVFTSAGDGGQGMSFAELRERAGTASMDVVLNSSDPWSCDVATVRTHAIRRCSKGSVIAYYMRLPDGAPSGEGYADRGSMSLLRDGHQATITALDGSTTYTSWSDVVFTLRAIVDDESAGQGSPFTVVNSIEYDRTLNNRDHPDRLATADALNSARAGRIWDVNLFIGSAVQNLAANLTQEQHDLKADIYNGYDSVIGAAGYGHPKYDSDVQSMMWRTYSRVAPMGHTDVYVQGHADDWQLFAGEAVNASMQYAGKVVLVYTTAGDANLGAAFWQARETSAQNSVVALMPSAGDWMCGSRAVNAHMLWRCERGNVVAWYLRLPDGAQSGEGFQGRGSIMLLRDGYVSSLTSMDDATTYTSWADLTGTMAALIDLETGNGSGGAVNVASPEYDVALNPHDHPDHLATGDLVRAASANHMWGLTWFVGYDIQNRPANMTQEQHDLKAAAFLAADSTMSAAGFGTNRYEPDYQAWQWRSYMRQTTP